LLTRKYGAGVSGSFGAYLHVEVYVPESYMGEIIGDLNKRRGRILGMNPRKTAFSRLLQKCPKPKCLNMPRT